MTIAARLDDIGKPAWIALMIAGFVVWWPIGHHTTRSEERTSELQSLRHLVCRLLLEKKKIEDCLADAHTRVTRYCRVGQYDRRRLLPLKGQRRQGLIRTALGAICWAGLGIGVRIHTS